MGAFLFLLILAFLKSRRAEGIACWNGFTPSPTSTCVDIDECQQRDICPKGDCVNTIGTYYCQCFLAFMFNDKGHCVDVDECTMKPQICGDHSVCTNTMGNYTCKCNSGFSLQKELCVDVDECTNYPKVCVEHSTCVNTMGSYSCHCSPGFRNAKPRGGRRMCLDINECAEDKSYCGEKGICQNLIGSSWCQCSAGFTNYGQNGTKCVELSCDKHETQPNKTLPGLNHLVFMMKENCLRLWNSTFSEPGSQPSSGDVLLTVLINATDVVQLSFQKRDILRNNSDVTRFLETVENSIRLIAPQLNEHLTRIETDYTEAEILVNRNTTPPKVPVSLTNKNVQLDTTWEAVVGNQNNYSGFAFVSLLSYKTADILKGNPAQAQQLLSNAVTVSIGNPDSINLHQPINLTFRHLQFGDVDSDCVYWSKEDGLGTWSGLGCTSVMSNSTHTVCSCNHLSTFSLLQGLQKEKGKGQLSVVMWAGFLVALACVVLSITATLLCRYVSQKRRRRI